MKMRILVPAVALLMTSALASPASAQLGNLRSLIPGGSTSSAAAVDPDAFLAETTETTRMMMVAAAYLNAAYSHDQDRDALRARITSIQGASNIGELNAHSAAFEQDIKAIEANASDAQALQATYDASSAQQQQLMMAAAFNFALGMARNVQLAQQAPQLVNSLRSNPMLLMKLNSIRVAAGMIGVQVEAARTMGAPLQGLLSRGGVQVPENASTTDPMTVEIV